MGIIPNDMIIGTEHKTNKFGILKVLKYVKSSVVKVEFIDTGYKTSSSAGNIRRGNVKDKMIPVVYGVGFIGDGSAKSGGRSKSKAYIKWTSMLERCYSEGDSYPWYKDCSVCKEWHNFQNFSKWFDDNYPDDGGDYHLDKDIKISGNKVYSPSSCSFVSRSENISDSNVRGNSKEYEFKNPKGIIFKVHNLAMFCRDNDLTDSCMNSLYHGRVNSHKVWTR